MPRENFKKIQELKPLNVTSHFQASENQAKPRFAWQNQVSMQQDVLLHFWVIFFKMRWKYENFKLLTRSTGLLVALYLSKLDGENSERIGQKSLVKYNIKVLFFNKATKNAQIYHLFFHRLPATQYVEKFHFLRLNRKA